MIRGDIAIKALDVLTEQTVCAIKFMAISSTNPNDQIIANEMVNGTASLLKGMLYHADGQAVSPQA